MKKQTIKKLVWDENKESWGSKSYIPKGMFGSKCGDMVAVRPCADEYENKTYLGVFIGEVALSQSASFNKETGEMTVGFAMHNPMIFIPSKNAVVWGCGSWWGKIKSEKELKDITDAVINNQWYVKALQQIQEKTSGKK